MTFRGAFLWPLTTLDRPIASYPLPPQLGQTPLFGACSGGHLAVVCLLLVHGARVDSRDKVSMLGALGRRVHKVDVPAGRLARCRWWRGICVGLGGWWGKADRRMHKARTGLLQWEQMP